MLWKTVVHDCGAEMPRARSHASRVHAQQLLGLGNHYGTGSTRYATQQAQKNQRSQPVCKRHLQGLLLNLFSWKNPKKIRGTAVLVRQHSRQLPRYLRPERDRPCGWSHEKPAKARLMCIDIEAMPDPTWNFPIHKGTRFCKYLLRTTPTCSRQRKRASCHLFAVGNIDSPLEQIDEFDPSTCTLHCSEAETEMLMNFEAFIKRHQPDVISGWNTNGFDLPYLFDRTVHVLQRPPKYGRDAAPMSKFATKKGKAIVKARGRIFADMLDIWKSQQQRKELQA